MNNKHSLTSFKHSLPFHGNSQIIIYKTEDGQRKIDIGELNQSTTVKKFLTVRKIIYSVVNKITDISKIKYEKKN